MYIKNMSKTLALCDMVNENPPMKVQSFGYRRSHIEGKILAELPRDMMSDFELCLAARAGVHPDNHTGYLIQHNGESIYVHVSDRCMYFATDYSLGDF